MIDPLTPSKYQHKRTITLWNIYKNNAIAVPSILYYHAKRITIMPRKNVTQPKTHEHLNPYQPNSIVQHHITFKEKTKIEEATEGTLEAIGELSEVAEIIASIFEAIGSIFEALG